MSDIFLTNNQKLVKQWKKEHQKIVALAEKIIYAYEADKKDVLNKDLDIFYTSVSTHLMGEDMSFYEFSMLEESLDKEVGKQIEEFVDTFEKTKFALVDFLTKYTLPDAVYDQEFIDTFKMLFGVLAKRISYEEENLYKTLQAI